MKRVDLRLAHQVVNGLQARSQAAKMPKLPEGGGITIKGSRSHVTIASTIKLANQPATLQSRRILSGMRISFPHRQH